MRISVVYFYSATSLCVLLLSGLMAFLIEGRQLQQPQRQHTANSAQLQSSRSVHTARSTQSGHVTILIIDMSGSMVSNDSLMVRCSAANTYVNLSEPGDIIGVIALTSGDEPSNQPEHAIVWQKPTPMTLPQQRDQLTQLITQKCQQQSAIGDTPTYDALAQTLQMLNAVTHTSNIAGSVILLTDGVPYPNPSEQINDIQQHLLPQFQIHHWPIDTIALGDQQVLRPFLQNLASKTGGIAYDDVQGDMQGQPSPLNITNFLVNIFAQRVGGTFSKIAPPTRLSNTSASYETSVDNHVHALSIIVAKDSDEVTVQLTADGAVIAPTTEDTYYVIFSVEPEPGQWLLRLSGTGNFEVSRLVNSWLQVSILVPQQDGQLLSLDRAITLSAAIVDTRSPDEPLDYAHLHLVCVLTYEGNIPAGIHAFTTQRYDQPQSTTSGTYQFSLNLPPDALPGTYMLVVSVSGETSDVISEAKRTIRLEHFPYAQLVTSRAVEHLWPLWLHHLYASVFLAWLDSWILPDRPTPLPGIVVYDGKPFITAHIEQAELITHNNNSVPLTVTEQQKGHFTLLLPALPPGTYTIQLSLNGQFEDDTGSLGDTEQRIQITTQYTLPVLPLVVLGVLAVLLLGGMLFIIVFITGPAPFGDCISQPPTNGRYPFAKARRRMGITLWRNTVYSEQVYLDQAYNKTAKLPSGLIFRFHRKGVIKVRRRWTTTGHWYEIKGEKQIELSRWRSRRVKSIAYSIEANGVRPLETTYYQINSDR